MTLLFTPSHHTHPHAGSFGQSQPWKLGDPSSYQYPLAPEDIRLNPNLPTLEDQKKETKSLEILLDAHDESVFEGQSTGGVVSEGVDGGTRGGGGQSDLPSNLEEMSSQEVQTHSIPCKVIIANVYVVWEWYCMD